VSMSDGNRVDAGSVNGDREALESADVAVANVLERFYMGLFRAANVTLAAGCAWALWREATNGWHDQHLPSLAIGVLLLVGAGLAVWQSDRLFRLLRRRPALTFVPTTIVLLALWIDGTRGSEFFLVCILVLLPIAVATIDDPRWTLGAAAYLIVGDFFGLNVVNSVSWTHLDAVHGSRVQPEHVLACLLAALLFIYALERGASFVARSNQIINDERARLQARLKRAQLEARDKKLEASEAEDLAHAAAPEPVAYPGGSRLTNELSAREVEVCQLVSEGLSNNDIAEKLFLSPRTVQSHVANAMMKTHTESRTQLAVLMIRDGLVPAVHNGDAHDDEAGTGATAPPAGSATSS
jgi:DNA-binding CsgD family transcriptional regulator